ncbi:DUF2116 family Zn-ribbon domain-containing protein [Rufibacter latericius]|uniref:DUF2116 family Zn-ribbon domain-containing protein n=1 Tax=Rufibacter latericius TaxID=2487040 RepID=A0A3M9MDC2_9BACT|nr:DUF2116 family Zn-ribbon domain-containing protein [Rufibacter latericius]
MCPDNPEISECIRITCGMEKTGKLCGHCGEPITGRADKRFCSDQCRSRSGNRKKMEYRGEQLMR